MAGFDEVASDQFHKKAGAGSISKAGVEGDIIVDIRSSQLVHIAQPQVQFHLAAKAE